MKRSKISWCDFSGGDLNWLTGCQKVSEGCRFCYAEAIYKRFGRDFSTISYDSRKLKRALRARYPQDGNVRGPHSRPLCFVCDTSDFFYVGPVAYFWEYALEWMGQREDVDWVILTKRPQNIPGDIVWSANVWLGVTAENQARADERIPLLLKTGAKVKFVSVEPMLGPVHLDTWLGDCISTCGEDELGDCKGEPKCHDYRPHGIDWVICGGESGPKRRKFDLQWPYDLWQECRSANIPFFYKQGSAFRPGQYDMLWGEKIKEWPKGATDDTAPQTP